MQRKVAVSAIALAFFSHGLTFYFTVAGMAGIHTTILTAAFQIGVLLVALQSILLAEKAKKKFFRFQLLDAAYFIFILLYLYDLKFSTEKVFVQDNVLIYFTVCWGAAILNRSLTFEQFKIFCQASTVLTSLTSFMLLAQVFTGQATWADNGGRLVAGTSGNPILIGYTGAYAFMGSLILWITGKPPKSWVWLLTGGAGLMTCTFSGTRSATVSLMVGSILIGFYTFSILFSSNKTTARFLGNSFLVAGLLLFASLTLDPLLAPASAHNAAPSPIMRSIDAAINRINILFSFAQGGGGDLSLQGREELYTHSWTLFINNPIWGGGLYSAGNAHNAFLQVSAEFGILGIITFILPLLYLGYRIFQTALHNIVKLDPSCCLTHPAKILKSDFSMMTCFAMVLFIQTMCLFSFHGTPYTNTVPVASMGLLIAFSRLKNSIQT